MNRFSAVILTLLSLIAAVRYCDGDEPTQSRALPLENVDCEPVGDLKTDRRPTQVLPAQFAAPAVTPPLSISPPVLTPLPGPSQNSSPRRTPSLVPSLERQPVPGRQTLTQRGVNRFASLQGSPARTRPVFASIPFMIGDTGSGSCATISLLNAISADVEHPTLICSRLNVSENNSALLTDRAYASYRHFHNVTDTNVLGAQSSLNIDRVLLGMERTFGDGMFSAEFRLPLSRELSSAIDIIVDDANPARNTLPLSDRDAELGNMSAVIKASLLETQRFQLTGGLAVLIPTADDVSVHGDLQATLPVLDNPVPPNPALFQVSDILIDVEFENESVNLSPFLALLWSQSDRLYFQGFLQLDVSANPSDARVTVQGDVAPFLVAQTGGTTPLAPIFVDFRDQAKIHQQTLMRLNLGGGYQFYRGCPNNWLRSVTGILEMHYTTTLQDAKLYENSILEFDYLGQPIPLDVAIGNGANRNDILNLAVGGSASIGKSVLTTGIVMPLRDGADKPFDTEINVQLQRLF